MGFMAITDEVNVELLNECFELRPFHGLYKSHPNDILQPPESDDSTDSKSSLYFSLIFFFKQHLGYFKIVLTDTEIKHKLSNGGIIES